MVSGRGREDARAGTSPLRLISNAAHLYRLRVREQPLQEVLALFGIAAGVALLFAVQIAIASVTGSVRQLAHGITGRASLEVAARGPRVMDERLVARAARLASVEAAAPVLQQRITVVGQAGRRSLTLVGVDDRLARLGGDLVRRFRSRQRDLGSLGLFLTAETAGSIGAGRGQMITIESAGQKRELPLAGTLTAGEIGGLAESPVAVAPLGLAQRLAGMPDRISRVLIVPKEGAAADAAGDLRRLARGRLDVRPSDSEADLMAEALKPDRQSSATFGAVAVAIGLLFAYNAMLLAIVRRRRMIAYLRMLGADRSTVIATLVFEAVLLGAVASLLGLAAGELLSRVAFRAVPRYLAAGFPIGGQRVVEVQAALLAMAGGLGAALLASAKPAFDLYRVNPAEAIHERAGAGGGRTVAMWGSGSLWAGAIVIAGTSGALVALPGLTPLALGPLILGLVLVLGPVLAFVLAAVNRATRVRGGVGLSLAVEELAGKPARAAALAVIAAGALTAIVSIGGSRQDIERGVDRFSNDLYGTHDLWVMPESRDNIFLTQPFVAGAARRRIARQSAVRRVGVFHGSFLDSGGRRLRVAAQPASDPRPLAPSQVVQGGRALATKRIRAGGWVALSEAVVRERGLDPGDRLAIPAPSGARRFRLAAAVANYGWPSGGIVMNASDYRKAWESDAASALMIDLAPGTSPEAGKRAVERALGGEVALQVRTSAERRAVINDATVQGLGRIRQISILVLGAAVLAIVAAMSAAIWQRRDRLASLRAIGMFRSELYRTLFVETSLIVFLGCVAGLGFGLYCQVLASRWTEIATGYSTPFAPALGLGLMTLIQAMALALLATAVPAYFASRVAPRAGEAT